jgi:hypothetical protein
MTHVINKNDCITTITRCLSFRYMDIIQTCDNGVLGLSFVTLFAVCVALYIYINTLKTIEKHTEKVEYKTIKKKRALASVIRCIGALVWPLFFMYCVLTKFDRCSTAIVFPLIWNFCMWYLDSYLMHYAPSKNASTASLKLDPSVITSLSFGLSGLLRGTGTYNSLFLFSIVGCLIFVLPSHNLEDGCVEEQIFESVQKAALLWCIGVLIAAVALSHNQTQANNRVS